MEQSAYDWILLFLATLHLTAQFNQRIKKIVNQKNNLLLLSNIKCMKYKLSNVLFFDQGRLVSNFEVIKDNTTIQNDC